MIEKDNTPSDEAVQGQNALLETLRGEPYFRSFNPRAYPLFISRHYKPREYLEQIGVEKIGELIQHGLSLGDICKVLDVSTRVLRCWVFEEPTRIAEIQEARVFAADELVAETRRVANDCNIWPDTDRARLIVSTNQWIAERWDKDLYGTKQV
ncbi:MAG: hypothetical protein ACREQ5_11010, partial [Candidatus Dormibacteria bacterium]